MALVVVSNRIARPQPDVPIEGGLAAALLPAVENSGAVWVGASGRLTDCIDRASFAEIESLGAGSVAGIDLPRAHYAGYYQGFANSVVWPVLHSRKDLVRAKKADYRAYRAVNHYMAHSLLRFVTPEAAFWVHDYHFLPLASELRALRVSNRIGFFLHTPFPSPTTFAAIPQHRELAQAMLEYDVLGFQTQDDCNNFVSYISQEFHLPCVGGVVTSAARATTVRAFPIGIDAERFARRAMIAAAAPEVARLRSSLDGAQLAIGVDRIDHSKGLPNKLTAFDRMLTARPDLHHKVALLQIANPSRQQIESYRRLHSEVVALAGDINGRHGDVDWSPVRYLTRSYPQAKLAGFYRTARVGLVTPHRDGMNLVAKEYVAAQNPHDPGVLVLSRYAGAAKQLRTALLVDPDDIDRLASTVAVAFAMPIEERRERWQAMMDVLSQDSLDDWFKSFMAALQPAGGPMEDVIADEDIDLVPVLPRGVNRDALQVS